MQLKKKRYHLFWLFVLLISGQAILFLGRDFFVHAGNFPKSSFEPPEKTTASIQNIKKPSEKIVLDRNFLKPVPEATRAGDPMVLLELFPWVREINRLIPRRFSLAEHDVILDPNQIVIRHQFLNTRVRQRAKNSLLTLSYSGALGREINTRMELPLFYSPALGLSGWERYPFGNYTMTILRGSAGSEEIYLRALTRF